MKILYILFLLGLTFHIHAVDCDLNYNKNGCDEAVFDLDDDMYIYQYRVIYDGDQDGVSDKLDLCPDSVPNTIVDENGCTREVVIVPVCQEPQEDILVPKVVKRKAVKIVPLKINFATFKFDILENSFPDVQKFATFMIKNPEFHAKIVGHTDSQDKRKLNLPLSLDRAKSVVKMLIALGVEDYRLKAEGVGHSKPIATNDTPEGRAKNRRIEAILSKEVK